MKQYAIAMTPSEGELCPLLRVGIVGDLANIPLNDGEMIVEADLRGNASRVRPGTWNRLRPCPNYDDDSLHTHAYYLTKTNGEFGFVITEPPCITWFSVRANVSASLTIS